MSPINAAPHAVAICSLALLAACGGGNVETTASQPSIAGDAPTAQAASTDDRKTASAVATSAALENPYTNAEALILFDWAQYSYPSLFVDSQSLVPIDYLGTSYIVRSYPNGNNLGLTLDGRIFGLGPFTGNALQGFGKYTDYVEAVERDRCGFRPQWCVPAKVATAPVALSVPAQQSGAFSVTASGTAPFTYQWLRNGVQIPGATEATYNIAKATYTDDLARYSVQIRNAYGSATSTEATLTVTSPLIGRGWAAGQALEENTSTVSVKDRVQTIDDAGTVTVLFRKSNGVRDVLYATRGTPNGRGAAASWSPPVAIDVLNSVAINNNGQRLTGYRVQAAPTGDVVATWAHYGACTAATYDANPANSCWYMVMARFAIVTGQWEPPVVVTDVPYSNSVLETFMPLDLRMNSRGDLVFQGRGWARSGTASFTAARVFLFRAAGETTFRRQTFQSEPFGTFYWDLDGAGNLLLAAELAQNATTDIVAYRGTVASGFAFGTAQVLDTRASAATLYRLAVGINGQQVVTWGQNNAVGATTYAATSTAAGGAFAVTDLGSPNFYGHSLVTDEGQVILYAGFAQKRTWTTAAGWTPVVNLPRGFPSSNWGFSRSGDILAAVDVGVGETGRSATYDSRNNRLVMGPGGPTGSDYVWGWAAYLGAFNTPLLSVSGYGYVDVLTKFDILPTPTAPAGDGRNVTNLWGAFLKY